MVGKRKYKNRPYYGRKGGTAEYKNEMKFDIFTTLETLGEYYNGRKGS